MARGNIPSHLVPLVGKKNWTKAELEEKKRREVILDGESIQPSEHLPKNLHDRFYWFVNERSEEHTSELQSRFDLVCRLLLQQFYPPSQSPLSPYTTLFRS